MNAIESDNTDPINEFYQKLGKLRYQDRESWRSLPTWARFYLELGTILGMQPTSEACLVIALAVPSRTYVASLIAAGCILSRALLHHKQENLDQHIEWLCQLAADTPVLVRHNGRRLVGRFQGVIYSNGRTYYMVRTDSGARTTSGYAPNEIQPLEEKEIKLPKSQKGHTRQEIAPLITSLLGENTAAFSSQTCLDCVLNGTASAIKGETQEQRLAIQFGNRGSQEGLLLDMLRPKRLLHANSAYRSYILSSSNKRAETFAKMLSPHLVILDGSLSYLKQRQIWQGRHTVIILDRTEPQFEPASEQVNQEYYRRLNRDLGINLPRVPAGVEAMPFEVRA